MFDSACAELRKRAAVPVRYESGNGVEQDLPKALGYYKEVPRPYSRKLPFGIERYLAGPCLASDSSWSMSSFRL
eukprot:884585-Rhodomonas_salina.1